MGGASLAALVMTLQGTPEEGARTLVATVGGLVTAGFIQALWRFIRRKQAGDKDRLT